MPKSSYGQTLLALLQKKLEELAKSFGVTIPPLTPRKMSILKIHCKLLSLCKH